jgi:hypothetical protein
MKNKIFSCFALMVLVIAVTACSAVAPQATPTATTIPTATEDVQATQAAQEAASATEKAGQQATESAYATQTQVSKVTTVTAAAEMRAATRQAATAQAVSQATKQAEGMAALVQKLNSDKLLSTTEGKYLKLDGFSESWAQIDWYQWYNTGYAPGNFVLSMDVAYESASKIANWESSGCGIVFRENDGPGQSEFHHYRLFYALDGNVYFDGIDGFMTAWDGNQYPKWLSIAKKYYGRPVLPKGNFQMTIVADKDWITVLVDGKQIIHKQDKTFDSGDLSYTLASGTNKDFGTHCTMTNVEMWVMP